MRKIADKTQVVIKRLHNKKTHEEYVEEVKVKNPNVTVIGTYIDARTKITHRCNLCDCEWESAPTNILSGHWCKSCSLKEAFKIHPKTQPKLRKSHEQYVKDLYEANPNIEILDKYITTEHKSHFKCKICGHEWYGLPRNYLSGKGCPECARRKETVRKTFTHEEFIDKLSQVNEFIEVLGEYINSKTKIACRCKIDSHEFYATPSLLLAGHGCPECSRRNSILDEKDFFIRVKEMCPTIKILTPYTKATDNYLCECIVCGHQWIANGNNILRGQAGCKECFKIQKRLTNHEFLIKLSAITNDIIPLDEYHNMSTKIRFQCRICNHVWKTSPASVVLNKSGCPKCNESVGERIIRTVFDNNFISFIRNKTFNDLKGLKGRLLSYDFYLPQYNFLVEFQGEQHEHPVEHFGGEEQFKVQQEHDRRKREYAEKNNINLLEIWYYDIGNIESILLQKINEINENNLKLESVETAIST